MGYVNWKIDMHARPDQDGHCGNFNGNAADDDRLAVRQRVGTQGVPAGPEMLFSQKTPVTVANRPDINNCPQATMDAACRLCCKIWFCKNVLLDGLLLRWKGGGFEQMINKLVTCYCYRR